VARSFRWGAVATAVALVFLSRAQDSTAEAFEPLPVFSASAILPADLVQGPHFHVRDQVGNDGYFNIYVIDSDFGVFKAVSNQMLRTRIVEIGALAQLKQANDAAIVAGGVAGGFGDLFEGAANTAANPVGTVESLPGTVSSLFGFADRKIEQAAQSFQASGNGGQGSSTAQTIGSGAQTAALNALGVTDAERRWAVKLGVDPYTTNVVLRKAIKRAAELEAAGRFSINFVPGGAAMSAISAASTVHDLETKDWSDVQQANQQRLAAMGASPSASQALVTNPAYTPTWQTLLIRSLDTLAGRDGRAEFVVRAATANSEERARFFVDTAQLMVVFDGSEAKVVRLLPEASAAGALAGGRRVVELMPFDFVVWTEDFANHVEHVTRYVRSNFHKSHWEVWLTGKLSDRTRQELRKRGWKAHEQALRIGQSQG
jgi:hypothetical protein